MSRLGLVGWIAFTACAGSSSPSLVESPESASVEAPLDGAAAPVAAASWEGGSVSFDDLAQRTEVELRAMEIEHALARYDLQSQALDALVVERLLTIEAKRLGHPSIDALLAAEVEAKVPEPTEAQVAAFYPVVERQLQGATLDEARPFLKEQLLRQAQQEAYGAYLDGLRQRMGVKVNLTYPDLPRVDVAAAADDPTRGAADAPVTIVQFAEYQCYYCNKVSPTLDALLQKYDGKVKVVFKDFPLQGHSRAMPAAIAAHCAGEQGKYWELNRLMLERQQNLADADLVRYATEVGVDADKFQTCQRDNHYEEAISADVELGRRSGVNATPAFFVNGIMLSGAQPMERFEAVIDRELAARRSPG
jgi:protein-disulfide isomerase